MFEVSGLTFHLYGLIIGLAVVMGLSVAEAYGRIYKVEAVVTKSAWIIIITGLIGARMWHVVTDWHLYQYQWSAALYVWQGGLSILGAVVGGAIGAALSSKYIKPTVPLLKLLDISVLGLPFAQALGRWGNYVNQELYGWPTNGWWGVYIDVDHRLSQLQNFERFQPLFLYESLALLIIGLGLQFLESCSRTDKKSRLQVGTGSLCALYVASYGWLRFGLEFLRPDKALLTPTLGVNQLVVLGIAVVSSGWLLKQRYVNQKLR